MQIKLLYENVFTIDLFLSSSFSAPLSAKYWQIEKMDWGRQSGDIASRVPRPSSTPARRRVLCIRSQRLACDSGPHPHYPQSAPGLDITQIARQHQTPPAQPELTNPPARRNIMTLFQTVAETVLIFNLYLFVLTFIHIVTLAYCSFNCIFWSPWIYGYVADRKLLTYTTRLQITDILMK